LRWRYASLPRSRFFCAAFWRLSQGVKQVKKKDLNARYLSLQPPSLEILESRLRGRATDSEDAITQRLTQAKNELEFAKTPGVFDKVIINDDLEKAWKEFKAFCVSEE
jgi:guanylate kinase